MSNIDVASAGIDTITVEILKARSENAALSDLYLFWLALNGVERGCKVMLSWIADVGGEPRNLSSITNLLTVPDVGSKSIRDRAGGLTVEQMQVSEELVSGVVRPGPAAPKVPVAEISRSASMMDRRAGAAAVACARRVALQWILGPSSAFQSEHHHAMLYGNVEGALIKRGLSDAGSARRSVDDLWRHLTRGQRVSSHANSAVKDTRSSAHAVWVLTLEGLSETTLRKRGIHGDRLDLAYQYAIKRAKLPPAVFVPAGSEFLPPPVEDAEICKHCPVKPSCAFSRAVTD